MDVCGDTAEIKSRKSIETVSFLFCFFILLRSLKTMFVFIFFLISIGKYLLENSFSSLLGGKGWSIIRNTSNWLSDDNIQRNGSKLLFRIMVRLHVFKAECSAQRLNRPYKAKVSSSNMIWQMYPYQYL
jgi:hypothetical protein